jgi:hypothetical protein
MNNCDDFHAQGPESRGITSDAPGQWQRLLEQRSSILSELTRLSADSLRNILVARDLLSRDVPAPEAMNRSSLYETSGRNRTCDSPASSGSPSLPVSINSCLLSKIPYSGTRSGRPIHVDMARHSGPPVRTFIAEFPNPSEAERFIIAVANKHGQLEGRQYTCSRYGKGGPAGEPVSAFVEFCPESACAGCTTLDFAPLLSEHGAHEI